MEYGYLFYIVIGFLSGSILFGRIIPFLLKKVDVMQESDDGNPGAFNAFACGGPGCGFLALFFDLLKGALPIMLCKSHIGIDSWLFTFVVAAPVFGIGSLFVVKYRTIMCGCILIAGIVIHKHYLSAIACEHDRKRAMSKGRNGGFDESLNIIL